MPALDWKSCHVGFGLRRQKQDTRWTWDDHYLHFICLRALTCGGPLCPVQKKEKKPGYHFDSYIFSLDRLFGSQLANGIGAFPVTKQDIEEHFSSHGSGKIMEIKLMSGFGFIEYEDGMDARDVVPGKLLRY